MTAKDATYRVPFRRRRERITDYRLRGRLVLSKKVRFIPRISLRYVTVQLAEATPVGDRILIAANSGEVAKTYGWPWSCKNVPAAYLTGLLVGYRAIKKGIKEVVVDTGLYTSSKGAKIYAAVKGAIDAGLDVYTSKEVLPDEKRIMGNHITRYASALSTTDPELYKRQFSGYLSRNFRPELLSKCFEEVKAKIVKEFSKSEESEIWAKKG